MTIRNLIPHSHQNLSCLEATFHSTIFDIKDRISESISFSFAKASVCDIIKIIKGLDPKLATGFDTIPPKLVILSSDVICEPLTQLINVTTIDSHLFPTCEKVASVTPAFKKDDVEKAFDNVWHNGLRYKIFMLDLPTKMTRWLSDFLVGRVIQVNVNRFLSDKISANAGVPQGSVLSPGTIV